MADRRFLLALQQLRQEIAAWAQKHDEAAFLDGMRAWLGDDSGTDEEAVLAALAFAIASTPEGGEPLYDRYAADQRTMPRIRRRVIATWQAARFAVVRVAEVEVDRGLHLLDVNTGEASFVHERAATHEVLVGEWLAVLLIDVGGHLEIEGAALVVPRGARHGAVRAWRDALGDDAAAPSVDATRRAMRPVARAAQVVAPPDRADAAWADAPHPALDGQTPRQAWDARAPEVEALAADLLPAGEQAARAALADG